MKLFTKAILLSCGILFFGCEANEKNEISQIQFDVKDEKDFSYKTFFLPRAIGSKQPYAGDCMPYYEDGVFYVYYLKDGGDSFNHSVFLATTSDFVTWTEIEKPVLEASRTLAQDSWIGTGSVVKIGSEYVFFYTGHSAVASEYGEKIMAAKSDNLYSFSKIDGWSIVPDETLGQKRDFRDPQAYFDEKTGRINLTVTACKNGKARVLKYSMDKNLENVSYDGIIFTDDSGAYFNLECSDTFEMNGYHYLTYSAQDDTHFYAVAKTPYGQYSNPRRLDGKVLYAAKHAEKDGENYFVGWVRRSEEPSFISALTGWAGNIVALKINQRDDGSLYLSLPAPVLSSFTNEDKTLLKGSKTSLEAKKDDVKKSLCLTSEKFLLKGEFSFEKNSTFGLHFACEDEGQSKLILIDSQKDMISLLADDGETLLTYADAELKTKQSYSFTYFQEGSCFVFCIDGVTSLTGRVYNSVGSLLSLFASKGSAVKFENLSLLLQQQK